MKLRTAVMLMLGMLPWVGLNAHQTESTVFRVTARVVEFCHVATTDLALANDTAQSGTPLLRAICTPNATYFVGVTNGASAGATMNQPKAVSGAQAPNYQLITGVGTGKPVEHTLFGGVPATQVVPPVDFGDTLSVRVYY